VLESILVQTVHAQKSLDRTVKLLHTHNSSGIAYSTGTWRGMQSWILKMKQISDEEEKPFTPSLSICPEGYKGRVELRLPSLSPPYFPADFCGYFLWRRRNRFSPPWCFLHDLELQAGTTGWCAILEFENAHIEMPVILELGKRISGLSGTDIFLHEPYKDIDCITIHSTDTPVLLMRSTTDI
jgi:hypothetical protein